MVHSSSFNNGDIVLEIHFWAVLSFCKYHKVLAQLRWIYHYVGLKEQTLFLWSFYRLECHCMIYDSICKYIEVLDQSGLFQK